MFGLVLFLLFLTGIAYASPLAAFVLILLMSVGYLWLPAPQIVHVHINTDEDDELDGAKAENDKPIEIEELKDDPTPLEVVRPPPIAANLVINKPVMEDDEWVNPETVDAQRESEWLESSGMSIDDIHRVNTMTQRKIRRETLWSHTGRWTKEDKEKYEIGRRRVEARIASRLRADGNMVIDEDAENPADGSQVIQDQPYAALMSGDNTVFHSSHFKNLTEGSGDLASQLRSTI